jgi:putative transposase
MPRTARKLVDRAYYHIINRGNNKQTIFRTRLDYLVFIGLLKEAKIRYPLTVFGYCLMPNHFHLIIYARDAGHVRAFIHWILTCFAHYYHAKYNTSGHLWQGRFKNLLIEREEYLIIALRYIENNPVRAGMVRSSRDWEWSSIQQHSQRSYDALVDPPPFTVPGDWLNLVNMPLTPKEFETIKKRNKRDCRLKSEKEEGQSPS